VFRRDEEIQLAAEIVAKEKGVDLSPAALKRISFTSGAFF
jgi:hypothetical protein